jgi:hypothetical protein
VKSDNENEKSESENENFFLTSLIPIEIWKVMDAIVKYIGYLVLMNIYPLSMFSVLFKRRRK